MKDKRKVTQALRKQISNAMKGNTNALKWTKKIVIKILDSMINWATEEYEVEVYNSQEDSSGPKGDYDKSIIRKAKRKVHLKKTLLYEYKIWNVNWFNNMRKSFKDDESVLCLLDAIDMICEVNTYNDAANGAINPAVAKMNLSTHYNWSDNIKKEVKQEINTKVDFELPQPSEEAMKKWEQTKNYTEDDDQD